jgi:hypothetical protein
MSPGKTLTEDTLHASTWNDIGTTVLDLFGDWLLQLKREIAVAARQLGGSTEPSWVATNRPDEIVALQKDVRAMEARIEFLEKRFSLLWQTGEPLNEAVAEVFNDIGFTASLTRPGATYDVLVELY